ncbi:MAG: hypothetical protein ABJF88_16555 [Rhodothermales bacterium]
MKQVILPAVLALVCFAASLVGTYAVVPKPAPEDAAADSLAVAEAEAKPRSTIRNADAPAVFDAALQDSLSVLRRELDDARRELETAGTPPVDRQAEAQALSGTLSKLEDAELRAILTRLDLEVVEMLYAASSARNRTRLLQALPSDRAARFVRYLTTGSAGDDAPAPVAESPVSEAAPATPTETQG